MVTAIVSPKALPRDNIAALTNPENPAGNNTRKIVSQRVPPKAIDELRNSLGMTNNTSREIAAIVGKIIMERIIPAVNILFPAGSSVLNSGMNAKVPPNHLSKGFMTGINTKIPHKPIITLGIAAINSTTKARVLLTGMGKKSSLVTKAMDIPTGTASKIAIALLTSVP